MLEAYLSSFSITALQAISSASLCLYVVRDTIKIRLPLLLTHTLLFVCANSVIFSIFTTNYNENYYLPIYGLCLVCGWWYLHKITGENHVKLFFLVCMTFNFIYFCSSITSAIYVAWMPQYTTGFYVYEDIIAFGLPLVFCWIPFAWFMRSLYTRLRKLSLPNMWKIGVIPLLFSVCIWAQRLLIPVEEVGASASCIMEGFIIFCAFLAYTQMVSALNRAEEIVKQQEKTKFLAHQFDLQKTRMEELETHAEEMRRIRHDRRQHVEVLKGLLSNGEVEKAREYLKDYETSISKNVQPPLCENFAADAICRRYQALAKQAGLRVELAVALSKNPGVSSSDLAIILGNLWENAIAAALDTDADPFIRLKVIEKDDKVFIRMENSFGNIVLQDDGTYLSTKAGRYYAEGIGLSSIKASAERYGGIAEFSHDQKVFTSSILLYRHNS